MNILLEMGILTKAKIMRFKSPFFVPYNWEMTQLCTVHVNAVLKFDQKLHSEAQHSTEFCVLGFEKLSSS